MSTSSSTQSAMYHGVDFWKIVAWVKDELAARLNSFVRRWDSSSKTLRLTIGRGVFQLALRSRGCRSRSTSATSRSLWLLAGNFSSRMWSIHGHTHSALFAEIWIASLAPTFLVGYQFASRRRTASQVLGARRSLPSPCFACGRSFPRGPAAPPQGRRATALDRIGMRHFNRRVWEAQSLSTRRMEIRRSAQASLSHSDNGRLSTPWREVIFL